MKLWLVSANTYDYDEYDAFVVRALSEAKALELVDKDVNRFSRRTNQVWTAKPLAVKGDEQIILGSFNAGQVRLGRRAEFLKNLEPLFSGRNGPLPKGVTKLRTWILKAMEVDGITSELRTSSTEANVTKQSIMMLKRDAEAHSNEKSNKCPFCADSDVIVIEQEALP